MIQWQGNNDDTGKSGSKLSGRGTSRGQLILRNNDIFLMRTEILSREGHVPAGQAVDVTVELLSHCFPFVPEVST